MSKIIITGGNGFLGSHLIDFLLKKENQIYCLERPGQTYKNLSQYTNNKITISENEKLTFLEEKIQIPTNNKNLIIIECDVRNSLLLEKIIISVKPKYIFHFGAQPLVIPSWEDPAATIEINVIGTINIFEPIKKSNLKTKVIVACTSAEYGTSTKLNRALRESDPLLAVNPYGISKIAAELISRQYYINSGIEVVNLRFFNQTGPRKVGDACADFVSNVAKIELGISDPIIEVGNLNTYRDFTDIKDSIQAIWLAAKKGNPGETFNVCSNKKIQMRQILDIILSFSKKKIKIKENTPRKLRTTDEDVILGDNSKIKRELGWKITHSIEETLRDMFNYWIEYYKKR